MRDLKEEKKKRRQRELIEAFDKEAKSLPAVCRRIETAFFAEERDWAKKSALISAKYKIENLMRCADELSWIAGGSDAREYPGIITEPAEGYTVTGSRGTGYLVTMPPLQKREYERRLHPQNVKAESVRAAVLHALEKQGLKKCIYDRCTLIYTLMIGPETGGNIGDADNLDTKQITDALTGIFYTDDNLTHVHLVIRAEMTDRPSYTKLEIREGHGKEHEK